MLSLNVDCISEGGLLAVDDGGALFVGDDIVLFGGMIHIKRLDERF